MPLVPAKCTEGGGEIEVNNEKKLGVCSHCCQPFVVEEAINIIHTITIIQQTIITMVPLLILFKENQRKHYSKMQK